MQLNRNNFAELFRSDYYTVEVWFVESVNRSQAIAPPPPKRYIYKVLKTDKLEVGDKVVVCVTNTPEAAEELKVCTVVAIDFEPQIEGESSFKHKWIVGRFDDLMAGYMANVESDTKLKRAVTKLESAMEKVNLRAQLTLAMEILDPETKKELAEAFNMPNLLGTDKTEAKTDGNA